MKKQTAKALALLLCALTLLALLSGCSSKGVPAESYDYAMEEAAPAEPAEAPMMAEPEAAAGAQMQRIALTTDSANNASEAQSKPKANLAEKIIYSGNLQIETTEFDKAVASIEAMVNEFEGFIENSEVYGNTRYNDDGTTTLIDRYACYTLRVPCGRFHEFLKRSGNIGNVLASSTTADNITSQFTDAEARKASLEVQEERLLAMMEQTTDIDGLISLESRLSEVRYELESIERQLINWQNSVDYSTVSLNLREVELYTPVASVTRSFGEKLSTAFADGWHSFVEFGKGLVLWLAEALPTLVLLALLILGIVLLIRVLRRRRKAKQLPYAQPMQASEESDT